MVQCAERTNPAAEHPSEEDRGDHDGEAPKQPFVKGARGQRAGEGRQRIGSQEVVGEEEEQDGSKKETS